jgi:predicted acylesterase/phospholipase RssA
VRVVGAHEGHIELLTVGCKLSLLALAVVAIVISAVVFAFVYPSKIHIAATQADLEACVALPEPQDHFVGVALSGGGSRAAVFAAAGLAELDARGVLEDVTHVSSVSGGGLPAAYLATHRKEVCPQPQDGSQQANCLTADFAALRPQLTRDYSNGMLWRQAWRPHRWFHPSERVFSLEEVFHQHITGGKTLAELPAHPVFLFNTVSYDTGSTFVMSNVPRVDRQDAPQVLLDPRLRTSSFSAPGCPRLLPEDTSLALAVASSAAFPPVYGPVTLSETRSSSNSDTEFIHLGDGGLSENTGVDALLEAGLDAHARNPRIQKLTLISFDAGLKIDEFHSRATHDLRLWSSKELSRLVDVPNLRGDRYRDVLRDQLIERSPVKIELETFVYLGAQIKWHEACPESTRNQFDTMRAYLASISTGFSITECDTEMMRRAAEQLVEAAFQKGGPLAALAKNQALRE